MREVKAWYGYLAFSGLVPVFTFVRRNRKTPISVHGMHRTAKTNVAASQCQMLSKYSRRVPDSLPTKGGRSFVFKTRVSSKLLFNDSSPMQLGMDSNITHAIPRRIVVLRAIRPKLLLVGDSYGF